MDIKKDIRRINRRIRRMYFMGFLFEAGLTYGMVKLAISYLERISFKAWLMIWPASILIVALMMTNTLVDWILAVIDEIADS